MFRILCFCLCIAPLAFATPFQLDTPPSLNIPSLANFSTGSDCFEESHHLPTNHRDCETAVSQIDDSADSRILIFSRMLDAEIKLPKSYRSGTCVIYLDMAHDADFDMLSLPQVAYAALGLVFQCVTRQMAMGKQPLGGITKVGPKKLLNIVMFGRTSTPADTQS